MPPPTPPSAGVQSRELKQRVLTCLHKLSDRDTYSAAASELETIARTLPADTLPFYLSSISATDASDKSPVRKQCLRLVAILSEHHGNALSPYLSKLLSAVTRRLRDGDSFVRSACVKAAAVIAAHVTRPSFSLIAKPFLEALFTEQNLNSQMGAAMCLSAVVDAAPEPDAAALRKAMQRLEKLVKSDNFKAKAALLTLIGSVIGVRGATSQQMVRNLVPCLVKFVSSEDWATRKSAAEALAKLAVVARDALPEFKASCLKTFEAKRFDKVKAVREAMNQTVAAWREIPDLADEESAPPESQFSSIEIASNGCYPPGSKISGAVSLAAPQARNKSLVTNKSSVADDGFSATTAKKISHVDSSAKRTGPAMFRKLDQKKPSDWKIDLSTRRGRSETTGSKDNVKTRDEMELGKGDDDCDRPTMRETKRALFNNVSKARVVPCLDDKPESTVVVSNEIGDHLKKQKESEDLSLIRKQLVQIENQQSHLLDQLQKYIGRSETGMRSLESRVHGLEFALDEISNDLAIKTGSKSNNASAKAMCCKLPGTEFFTSKLWKRTKGPSSASQPPGSGGIPSVSAMRNVAQNRNAEAFKLENRITQFQGGHGIIVNPLAEIPTDSQGMSEASSSGVSKNIRDVV